jgi:hypothetical protein
LTSGQACNALVLALLFRLLFISLGLCGALVAAYQTRHAFSVVLFLVLFLRSV